MKLIITVLITLFIGYHLFSSKKIDNSDPVKITINELRNNIRKYDGKKFLLKGVAKSGINIGGYLKYFEIDDGTGTINVISNKATPRKGEKVEVIGRFNQKLRLNGYDLLTIVEE